MAVTLKKAPTLGQFYPHTEIETVPSYVPTVAEDVFIEDVWLLSIHLANTSDSPVTVTITDRQATPMEVVPEVRIEGHSDHVREFSERYCPNGVRWAASAPDSVVGYIRAQR